MISKLKTNALLVFLPCFSFVSLASPSSSQEEDRATDTTQTYQFQWKKEPNVQIILNPTQKKKPLSDTHLKEKTTLEDPARNSSQSSLSLAKDSDLHRLALSISPFHLSLPVIEMTAELRIGNSFGLALIGGYGTAQAINIDGKNFELTVIEYGGQIRYYCLGDFDHGMILGVESLYIDYEDARLSEDQGLIRGSGFNLGPMTGYKFTADFGLIAETQVGAQFSKAATWKEGDVENKQARQSTINAFFNLNLGWAF